jgi:hypothetical protein
MTVEQNRLLGSISIEWSETAHDCIPGMTAVNYFKCFMDINEALFHQPPKYQLKVMSTVGFQ